MVADSVYEFSDYRQYLLDKINKTGRGEKTRLASVARCHVAYISQVLHEKAELSFEQAQAIALDLGLSEDESDFFLLLLSHARAGTAALQAHYARKIQKIRDERKILENRLKFKRTLPAETQATYYSAWYYAATHILLTIPGFRTRQAIAARLDLPLDRVSQVLGFLEEAGLAVRGTDGGYRNGEESVYIGNDSASLDKHHTHWRLRSVHALDRRDARDFHYTSVVSMAKKDAPAVRKILLEAVERVREVVRPSPEEELYCYSLDLFEA